LVSHITEEHMCKLRVLRKWWDAGENHILRSFIICTLHQIFGWWNQGGWDKWGL